MQIDSGNAGKVRVKVGYYLGNASLDQGGVAPYAIRVLESLLRTEGDSKIEVVVINGDTPQQVSTPANETTFPLLKLLGRRLMESYQVLTREGSVAERIQKRAPKSPDPRFASLDILHVPYQIAPTHELPYICTMHDVQELHFPANFSAKEREMRAIHYRKSIENAARVVVSFEHIKADLIRFFDCPEEKVRVMPLPYRDCVLKSLEPERLAEMSSRYANFGTFLLYPAQTWAHKNHLMLIEAFERARAKLGVPVTLVCTGKTNDYFRIIEKRIQQSEYANTIQFLGVVDEGELRWLYENCLGVVIPTLYEAGSFPLIEAMSLSAPVICSNVTSLPDTLGSSDYLFDPNDADALAAMMIRLSSDEDFRTANRKHCRDRIEKLMRTDIAEPYFNLWQEVFEEIRSK